MWFDDLQLEDCSILKVLRPRKSVVCLNACLSVGMYMPVELQSHFDNAWCFYTVTVFD